MKQLIESIFGDNITNDPWEYMIDHLNIKKYGREDVLNNMESIYNIGDIYEFYSDRDIQNLYECLLKSKGQFIMILKRQDSNHSVDYSFGYIPERYNDLFYRMCVGKKMWFRHLTQWSSDFFFTSSAGIKNLISKLTSPGNGYDSCSVITDKKKIRDIIKTILTISI